MDTEQPTWSWGPQASLLGVCRSAGSARGGRRAAVEGAVGAWSRVCAGDALWMLEGASSHCVDAWAPMSMTSSAKLQVPKVPNRAWQLRDTGRAEPYRLPPNMGGARVASITESRICTPSALRKCLRRCYMPSQPLSLSLPACDTLPAVHSLLSATAIIFSSFTPISSIAPPFGQAQDPEAHGLAMQPSPGSCLICQTVPSAVTEELHRSQALETNISLCCDRRLILPAKAL